MQLHSCEPFNSATPEASAECNHICMMSLSAAEGGFESATPLHSALLASVLGYGDDGRCSQAANGHGHQPFQDLYLWRLAGKSMGGRKSEGVGRHQILLFFWFRAVLKYQS